MQTDTGRDQILTGAAVCDSSRPAQAGEQFGPFSSADVEIGQTPRSRSLFSQARPSATRPLLVSAMHPSFPPQKSMKSAKPSSAFPLVLQTTVSLASAHDSGKEKFLPSCSPPSSPLVKTTRPTLRQSRFSTFFTSASTGSHPDFFPNDEDLEMAEEFTSPPNGWRIAQNLRDGAISEWESQRNTQPILLAAASRPTLSRSSYSDCGFLPPPKPHQAELFPLPSPPSPRIQSWVVKSSSETLASTPFVGHAMSFSLDGSKEPSHFSGPRRPAQFKSRPSRSPLHQHIVSRSFSKLPFRLPTPECPVPRSRSASVPPSALDPTSSSLSAHTNLASVVLMKGECWRASLKTPPSSCFGESQPFHMPELKLKKKIAETDQPENHGFQHIRGKTACQPLLPRWVECDRNFMPRVSTPASARGCVDLGDGSRNSYFPTFVS